MSEAIHPVDEFISDLDQVRADLVLPFFHNIYFRSVLFDKFCSEGFDSIELIQMFLELFIDKVKVLFLKKTLLALVSFLLIRIEGCYLTMSCANNIFLQRLFYG